VEDDTIIHWKKEAINDLMTYARKKESLTNMKQQIEAINMHLTSIRGAASDTEPFMGTAEGVLSFGRRGSTTDLSVGFYSNKAYRCFVFLQSRGDIPSIDL